MIIKSAKGGDYRDFARIADWARHIGVAVDGRSALNSARPGPNRAARPLPRGRRFSEPGGRGTTPARETGEAAARRGETAQKEKETER
ncbi:hypothetical protein [Streptomyces formicae]|uniref:Uncharacterized protein n=1 Tax=Streptomyces formicae TaxID=1616117 RepID=A0A291QM54_9ACTN|nr:hypothetical protein [Streptomyces formicae]ATL32564.1 hypothetical protein KY5_7546 [Streptomyces formicae]